MIHRMFFGLALMVMGLAVMAFPVLAQADCSFYSDNYLCYTGQIGCDDTDGASVSSAGQSGEIGQLACNRDAVVYIGVCDSGGEPQDDQFTLTLGRQVVSENYIDGAEYVVIYPITLTPGRYPLVLSVLRDSSPPGTYRVVAGTSSNDIERQLADVCGADFQEVTFELEGSGRMFNEPLPLVVYASYRLDLNGDGAYTNQDSSNIYLYDVYADREIELTDKGYLDFDPAWSPDGRTIIFASSGRPDTEELTLFSVPSSGGEISQLTDGLRGFYTPEYSPDGKTIAATCDSASICLMDADGSNVRFVLESNYADGFYWDPQWSPDGSKLLFVGRREDTDASGEIDGCDRSRLYSLNVDGTGFEQVTFGDYSVFGGDWSDDGSQVIYYAAWETGNGYACAYNDLAALGVVDYRTGGDTLFIPRGRFLRTPALSNDTTYATFTAPNYDNNRDGYLDARDTESLVVYLFNDGTQRRLTVTTFEVFDPSWSPLFIKSLDDLP